MNSRPSDQGARDRFTNEWNVNLAVVANAGSGKTTAIAKRLASMALSEKGSELLKLTAVVTYTEKAAEQIGQRARRELLARMGEIGEEDGAPLERLDRAFFGTIHRYCIKIAREHGSTLGVHMNSKVVTEEDDPWEEFVEQDPMQFDSLAPAQVDAFLRHASLDDVFELAKALSHSEAVQLARARLAARVPAPAAAALKAIMDATARKGPGAAALERNKATASEWVRRFAAETGRLAIPEPQGSAGGIEDLYRRLFAPVRAWLAAAGGILAAELSERYRAWRRDHGYQSYSDQIETAFAVLSNEEMLERVRREGRRVILDEAQDTDPTQFSVLVEITRPPGSKIGAWPRQGGAGPVPGHFCMVGDPQQGIYGSRADIINFKEHVNAFRTGIDGECLTFDVTFRAPRRVVRLLNGTLAGAFGEGRDYNLGLPPADGAAQPFLQVGYEPLMPGPENPEGGAWLLPITPIAVAGTLKVDDRRLADEARQIATFLRRGGPSSVGAREWGDICVIAPRNRWLPVVRSEFEAAGLKTALQMKKNRNGDNPVYAWMCGLLAVVCDPSNQFEWMGVLREVFAVSDAELASALRESGKIRADEPSGHPEPIRSALQVMASFIDRVDADGEVLGRFASDLSVACGLEAKARIAAPDETLVDELSRLLAQADELGIGGASPRSWLRSLLTSIDGHQALGRAASDAINLITSHSAKGLEWPVVIPVALWRKVSRRDESGMRVVSERGASRVIFDSGDLGPDTRESMRREWLREQVRLLYVTLTRGRFSLVVPWSGELADDESFAWFWGLESDSLDPIPESGPPAPDSEGPDPDSAEAPWTGGPADSEAGGALPAAPFPGRILPHELSGAPDAARAASHESSIDLSSPVKDDADPLEYGVWWHRLLEFVPWGRPGPEAEAYGAAVVAVAREGFRERAAQEWGRLVASGPWRLMRDPRWNALAEVGIFAPFGTDGWIDGVMDLVLHDPAAKVVWIVDWKTNRRQGGEDDEALLARLSAEYAGQLGAYGRCAEGFFPGCAVRKWVYSTVAGAWTEILAT